jgi:hypothetical protein
MEDSIMIEIKRLEPCMSGVYINLSDYANKEGMKCKIANINDEIVPESYSSNGTPYFTYDTFMKYANGDHYASVYVEVEYKPKELELDTQTFNTAYGISEYIKDLKTLNHIMNIRSVAYNKKGMRLNEFVWNGVLKFDQFGQTMVLSEQEFSENTPQYIKFRAVDMETFSLYCKRWCGTFKSIPDENDVCPHCGKKWSINDITNFITVEDKDNKYIGYHKNCLREHNNNLQLCEFQNVFSKVYSLNTLKFNYIPNEYCPCERCASWFIVSTPDGDIKIGWRKRVINIEWLNNYEQFTEKFESEDVTRGFGKYDEDRYIHAWSIDKAIEYLNRAKNSIIN